MTMRFGDVIGSLVAHGGLLARLQLAPAAGVERSRLLRLGGLGLCVQESMADSAFLESWLGLKAEAQGLIVFDPLLVSCHHRVVVLSCYQTVAIH